MAGKKYQVTIPEPLALQLEKTCKENGMSKSIIVTIALKEYLKFERKEQTDEQKK